MQNLISWENNLVITIFRISLIRALIYFKNKFSRSTFGQLWNVLSNAIVISAVSFVWSKVWNFEFEKFFLYYSVCFLVFIFLTNSINESVDSIKSDLALYRFKAFPLILSSFSVLIRNIVLFLFNSVIILVLTTIFEISLLINFIQFLLSVLLSAVFIFPICVMVSLISFRFRDVGILIQSLLSISILVSPVLWRVEQLPPEALYFLQLSPFLIAIEFSRLTLEGKLYLFDFWYIGIFQFIGNSILAFFLLKRLSYSIRVRI